jgi:F420H(2)-dependent quinone reductase
MARGPANRARRAILRPVRRLAAALALAAALFAGTTWLALEGRDVAVLRTGSASAPRTTRVWVAEADGARWLEAATPERAWYRDVLADPIVALEHGGATGRYRAAPEPGAEGHLRIRALLRSKYGWADGFVGLLQDTSRSVAVRLEPLAASGVP